MTACLFRFTKKVYLMNTNININDVERKQIHQKSNNLFPPKYLSMITASAQLQQYCVVRANKVLICYRKMNVYLVLLLQLLKEQYKYSSYIKDILMQLGHCKKKIYNLFLILCSINSKTVQH